MVSEFILKFKNFKLISNFKFQISNSQKGISLVEITIVVFIITLFSTILVSNFPQIQKNFAISRSAYKLAQDIRRVQDFSLSGVKTYDSTGTNEIRVKGYGLYVKISQTTDTEYIIYADVYNSTIADGSNNYDGSSNYIYCNSPDYSVIRQDCVIEIIDVSQENPDVYIKSFENINNNFMSINFRPPNPEVNIDNLALLYGATEAGIVLGLRSNDSITRTVWVNTSGLVTVQ